MEYEKNVTIKLPATLHRRLDALARERRQSVHRVCLDLLREAAFRQADPGVTDAARQAEIEAQVATAVERW